MTTVRAADGSEFVIPTGAPGSYPWVREASLLAVAYEQAGDIARALDWQREYGKRRLAWDALQQGASYADIINGVAWLDAPARIFARLAGTVGDILDAAGEAPGAVVDLVKWLPWLLLGGLAVVAIGFQRGTLRVRR